MGNVYADRPEIGQLSAAFRADQLAAFLRIEGPICGVEVLPYTPRMGMELEIAGNSYVVGGLATAEDSVQFIHRVSVQFSRGDRKQPGAIAAAVMDKAPVDEIKAYLKRSHAVADCFSDPDSREKAPPVDSSWASHLVDIFCGRYGWSIDDVLDTPYRILWQQMNRVLEDKNPDYRQRNPETGRIKAEYLKSLEGPPVAPVAARQTPRSPRRARRGPNGS